MRDVKAAFIAFQQELAAVPSEDRVSLQNRHVTREGSSRLAFTGYLGTDFVVRAIRHPCCNRDRGVRFSQHFVEANIFFVGLIFSLSTSLTRISQRHYE